jgi:tRNA pseudouridine38-40 synthase
VNGAASPIENKVVLVVEYDGGRYHGFQWQAGGVPTIQEELEKAIVKVTGETRRVMGASRTDAGVHARGQVVSFWSGTRLQAGIIAKALNHYLPDDIVVRLALLVRKDFNIRRDAVSRQYDYHILNRDTRAPLSLGLAHVVISRLNVAAMDQACQALIGMHDLVSFATFLGGVMNTVHTIYEAKVRRVGETVVFRIVGDSFLPHQVRNTMGLLIRVGLGKIGIECIEQVMAAKRFGMAGPTAPACGLYLSRINYPWPLVEVQVRDW